MWVPVKVSENMELRMRSSRRSPLRASEFGIPFLSACLIFRVMVTTTALPRPERCRGKSLPVFTAKCSRNVTGGRGGGKVQNIAHNDSFLYESS